MIPNTRLAPRPSHVETTPPTTCPPVSFQKKTDGTIPHHTAHTKVVLVPSIICAKHETRHCVTDFSRNRTRTRTLTLQALSLSPIRVELIFRPKPSLSRSVWHAEEKSGLFSSSSHTPTRALNHTSVASHYYHCKGQNKGGGHPVGNGVESPAAAAVNGTVAERAEPRDCR